MLDLFVSFQTTGPLNVRTLRGNFCRCPIFRKIFKICVLVSAFSFGVAITSQPPLLVHFSSTFLRTFDYFYSVGAISLPRTNQYCLGKWGYNNVVPALSLHPPLLSGNAVSDLLRNTLIPEARSVRYALRIPAVASKQYPPELRDWSV